MIFFFFNRVSIRFQEQRLNSLFPFGRFKNDRNCSNEMLEYFGAKLKKKKKGNRNERHIYLVIPSAGDYVCRNSPIMKRFGAHSEN